MDDYPSNHLESVPSLAASPPADVISGRAIQVAADQSLYASTAMAELSPLESTRAWVEPISRQGPTGKPTFRVPLKAMIIVAMCVFTLTPALVLWLISWGVGNDGVQSVNALGRRSVEEAASQLL
eukprot:RCo052283